MEIEDFIEKRRNIYSALIEFIDESDDYVNDFKAFIHYFDKQDILQNREEIINFLSLISKIEENHHRTPNFYDKFKLIFKYLINDKKVQITSSEIFHLYKNSKKMLLLLLENKFIIPDESILDQIFKMRDQNNYNYSYYLYSGIKPYISEIHKSEIENEITKYYQEDIETFIQKCQIGENDSYICTLIRDDSIEEFVSYVTRTNYSLSKSVSQSIYETNSFLFLKNPSLIEYAAFFGSIQIIQYLNLNNIKLSHNLFYYAVHSNNPDVIHFCEEHEVLSELMNGYYLNISNRKSLENKIYLELLKEAVRCHHNDIYSYIKNNLISQKIEEIYSDIFESYIIDLYNYNFYPEKIDDMISKPKNYRGFNISFLCSSLSKITIPSSVTMIGNSAFYGCSSLKKIIISSSVKRIGDDAFGECSSLVEILIPSSVTKIGHDAFKGCIKLEKIVIPSSVKSIGNNVFESCVSLVSIEIPQSVTSIGKSVFYGCSLLNKVKISSMTTTIGDYFFAKCLSLKEIEIPSSITSIGKHAFEFCRSLEKIELPSSLYSINEYAFNGCSSLKHVLIPSSVTEIGDFCFYGCSMLEKMSIPPSVTYIGDSFVE